MFASEANYTIAKVKIQSQFYRVKGCYDQYCQVDGL